MLSPQSPHKACLCVSSHPERSPTPWAAPSPALRGQGGHREWQDCLPCPPQCPQHVGLCRPGPEQGWGGCRLSTTWWALSPQHVPVSSFPPGGRLVASLLKKLHRLREAEPLPRGHTAIQQMTASAGLLFSTFPTWCLQITSSFQGPGAVSLTNLAPLFRTYSQI